MKALDLIVIFGYLAGVIALGLWFGRRQRTTRDYFLGDRNVPWWAIAASIVATETSTITFISVPGVAYARGGNFQFLQLVAGYMFGRIVIALLFIPSYFRGELLTVYALLQRRFGSAIKMIAAALFVVMRNIADGVRLLLTALVLAAVYTSFVPGASTEFVVVGSIVLIGVVMIVFTYYGGMEAVIWIEVVQLVIYVVGALAAGVVLANAIPGGFARALELGAQFDKLDVIDWGFRPTVHTFTSPLTFAQTQVTLPFDFTKTYTFFAGVIGGCFLTMSTHGTDQYLVQRYLCTDRPRAAATALLSSGAVVLAQFIGFLIIGVLLFAFYAPYTNEGYAALPAAQAAFPFAGTDRVFPDFITNHLPVGLSGLVVAAIFAAAMSSSLNSIAATSVNDLYRPFVERRYRRSGAAIDDAIEAQRDRHLLRVSHILTLVWGVVQIAVALLARSSGRSALDQALSIASLMNGPVLGVFLVGTFLKRASQTPTLVGMIASMIVMLYIRFFTTLAWTWYVLVGSFVTLAVAWAASFVFTKATSKSTAELAASDRV